jgi:replicative DNA helicase
MSGGRKMTQGIYQFPAPELRFNTPNDSLSPEHIEVEQSVLGGILLDPTAIERVKDRLKPQHFYVGALGEIYKACLALNKQGKPTDLVSVSAYLSDKKLLNKVGGRNQLARLVDCTVSAINIDAHAFLVIQASIRRDIIRTGNEFIHLGYATEIQLPEILAIISKRNQEIIDTPSAQTKEENRLWQSNKLLAELRRINTTIPQPTQRFFELKELTKEYPGWNIRDFEYLYLKSLVTDCGKPMTYQELKELAGSSVREWLLYGLVPLCSTILLSADGGVGKSKYAYNLAKTIIEGTQFGIFLAAGEKRKILFIQGDEQPGDMYEALQILGYNDDDINQYVHVWNNWTFENMPSLIHELETFKPEFVVMDSLTTSNRFSIYKEGEMEYARPILELNALAVQYRCSFLLIHHTNRDGKSRGSTAIRNAVSESWLLSNDKTQTGTPGDRLLEIDKSRSRSSGKKYRLYFDPCDLKFTFLGEESEIDRNGKFAGEKILQFLADHRNVKYTSKALGEEFGYSDSHARNIALELVADGLISVERQGEGKHNLYFLAYQGAGGIKNPSTLVSHPSGLDTVRVPAEGADGIKNKVTPPPAPSNPDTARISVGGAGESGEKSEDKSSTTEKNQKNTPFHQHPPEESLSDKGLEVLVRGAGEKTTESHPQSQHLDNSLSDKGLEVLVGGAGGGAGEKTTESHPPQSPTPVVKMKFTSPLGEVKAIAQPIETGNFAGKWELTWKFPLGSRVEFRDNFDEDKAKKRLKQGVAQWQNQLRFKVRQMGEDDYFWVEGCKCIEVAIPPVNCWWTFTTPTGEKIRVRGDDEFEIEKGTGAGGKK